MTSAMLRLILCFLLLMPLATQASYRIAAIVNDDVITTYDVFQRLALTRSLIPTPIDERQAAQLEAKTVRDLVTESLKRQEAERYSMSISADEINAAIRRIEERQNVPAGTLVPKLESVGLSTDSLKDQLEADLLWQRYITREVRRDVVLTDEEIELARSQVSRGAVVDQVQIASVVFPVAEGDDVSAIQSVAQDFYKDMLAGMPATQLLDTYEPQATIDFGPLTWVATDDLTPDLQQALNGKEKGGIAEPIVTPVGIQIIRVVDKRAIRTLPERNAEVVLKEILLPLNDESITLEIDAMMNVAKDIARYPGSCQDPYISGFTDLTGMNINVERVRATLATMPPDVRQMVEELRLTQITEPFASKEGIRLLMLCESMEIPLPKPDRDKVEQALFREKLSLAADKALQKIRREAFIDIRL